MNRMIAEKLNLPLKTLADFCRTRGIRKMSVFGSALRDDFRPDSDVDILIEPEPGVTHSLFEQGEMQVDLSEILGREVDLQTPAALSRYFRQQVMDTARVIYVRS